ncbi:MAG TPA: DUF4340 domain-containing protein [Dokdonella sp.]|uniref:DUF4340 domain-containing protein n=1 Tax=Dokdonella sp. TaxID=2291710 RepID=UPI002D7FD554|nr:DUF4340 domain-containing protein [Dokdonella sp.]HET9034404.1 DUF4340 domain-containing protein [Dokdonella sp.]
MKRATRTNLILIGVVVALGLAAYWQVSREMARFEPPLSTLDPASIQQVRVACLQCTPRRFERADGHWMMREPYDLPADDAQIARLLSIAASPVRSRRPLASLDAKKIGLDPALMSLELDSTHFDFGTTDTFNGDRYVRIGDSIAMAPDRFSPFLLAAPASELDRHLVPRGSTLSGMSIDQVDRPDLVAAWSDALASRITARNDPATSANGVKITLKLSDGSTISYRLVRDGDTFIADRNEPALRYGLTPEQATTLLGDAEAGAH